MGAWDVARLSGTSGDHVLDQLDPRWTQRLDHREAAAGQADFLAAGEERVARDPFLG